MTRPDYDAFFSSYVDGFNRAMGLHPDIDGLRARYAGYFVSASHGAVVQGGANDTAFARMLEKGFAFYKAIGLTRMKFRHAEPMPIDPDHDMVKVFMTADYVRKNGDPLSLDFDLVYMLQRRPDGPKIFAFVSGDELGIYRQHGLVDAHGKPV